MLDIQKDLTKFKAAELDEELALYRSIEGVAVPPEGDETLSNVEKRAAVITSLRAEHGHPVKLDAAFLEANPTLAKILIEQGAQEDDVVLAEVADLEKAAELDAEAEKRDEILDELEDLGDVVSDEEAEALSTADLEARLEEAKKKAQTAPGADEGTKDQGDTNVAPEASQEVEAGVQLYFQKKPVTAVRTRIINGRSYKEVEVVGETYTLTQEEFSAQVRPAESEA